MRPDLSPFAVNSYRSRLGIDHVNRQRSRVSGVSPEIYGPSSQDHNLISQRKQHFSSIPPFHDINQRRYRRLCCYSFEANYFTRLPCRSRAAAIPPQSSMVHIILAGNPLSPLLCITKQTLKCTDGVFKALPSIHRKPLSVLCLSMDYVAIETQGSRGGGQQLRLLVRLQLGVCLLFSLCSYLLPFKYPSLLNLKKTENKDIFAVMDSG